MKLLVFIFAWYFICVNIPVTGSGIDQQAVHEHHSKPHSLKSETGPHNGSDESSPGVELAHWNWQHVGPILTITAFIVLSGLGKVGFHYAHFISSRIPESCLLILVGTIMGAIVYKNFGENGASEFPKFSTELFFYALLPPIILEASYSLYDKAFFDNLATILLMAVVGTAFNFICIGLLIYFVFTIGAMGKIRYLPDFVIPEGDDYPLRHLEIFLFSSLISAVDPVAVLAIFQEVGVNPDLYFLVFGESLLNDGVAVVFYNMMNTFNEMQVSGLEITPIDITLGLLSFFTIAFGGLIIGIICGFITALITRTTADVRVVEPLALLGMAYLSFLFAELFHWSGIISIIGCGLVQARYAFKNVSKKSYTTVKYFIKMASSTSDCIIFLFLGIALVKGPHYWHTGFVTWTLTFCLIIRFIGVYGLTWIANRYRVKKINLQEQFIMAYGGLRGAVGFSLVEMIDQKLVPPKQMFVTTTLAIVMFTVFFQGSTIKFLVNLLGIDKKKDAEMELIIVEINDNVMENLMAGVEIISGKRGSQYFMNILSQFEEKYIMKIFCRTKIANDLTLLYEKIAVADHLCNLYGPAVCQEKALPLNLVPSTDLDTNVKSNGYIRVETSTGLSPDLNAGTLESGFSSPPLLPPRTNRSPSFFGTTFRKRSQTEGVSRLEAPSSNHSRRPSREDILSVRTAMRQNSFNMLHRKYNPNLINDDEQEIETHLLRRRETARRISQMVLQSTDYVRPVTPASNASMNRATKHRSFLPDDPEIPPDFAAFVAEGVQSVRPEDRLGVQAILSNYGRIRSKSMSSDRSGYSHKSSKNPSSPVYVEVYDKTRGGTSASSPASSIKSGDDKRKQTSTGKSGGKVSDTSQPATSKLSPLHESEEKSSQEDLFPSRSHTK